MKKLLPLLKRYRFFLLMLAVSGALLLVKPQTGLLALQNAGDNLLEMASILPPIFILLGLLDVWVERETMVRYLGEGSGIKGVLLAILLGSAAAGPLYAAFPVAAVFLKKGALVRNAFIFIGAWATTKIPLLLFEASSLGFNFMLLRLAFNLCGVVLIAFLLEKSLSEQDKRDLLATVNTQ